MGRIGKGREIRLAIRCAPIIDRMLARSRKKDVKHFKKRLVARLSFNNLITVDPSRIDEQAIRILVATYLWRDKLIGETIIYKLLVEFYGVEESGRQAHSRNICDADNDLPIASAIEGLKDFSVPLKHGSIKSFLNFHKKGTRPKDTTKRLDIAKDYVKAHDGIGEGDVDYETMTYDQSRFEDMLNAGDLVPKTTVYDWIKAGKMESTRNGWPYEKNQKFFEDMGRLNRERLEKKACCKMIDEILISGENKKSMQRKVQRWRKNGLSLREIADRLGYKPQAVSFDPSDTLDDSTYDD